MSTAALFRAYKAAVTDMVTWSQQAQWLDPDPFDVAGERTHAQTMAVRRRTLVTKLDARLTARLTQPEQGEKNVRLTL